MQEADKSKYLNFYYIFKFSDGTSKSFEILLDPRTLLYQRPEHHVIPDWAKLKYYQCHNCRLDESKNEYCPVAVNIAPIVDAFKDRSSYESAYILVMTKQRDLSKITTIEEGLTALLGIYMVASGCPTMQKLTPLVRYHLPFATMHESVVRVVSMYLFIQFYKKKKGKQTDWDIKQLEKIYERIMDVNVGMSQRLKSAGKNDACVTAISNLNSMASLLPLIVTDTFDEIEDSLSSYLNDDD